MQPAKTSKPIDTIPFKGLYGTYQVTRAQAAKHRRFLKTDAGKQWRGDCTVTDYEYSKLMRKNKLSVFFNGEK